ncbi:SDR family NAD(P)-dependent oxidoreductase [Streptomyces neyagawaensis]|uniref:SDR family NAD(P)-dependent oxidoreductase n=1 Tax=Streptomyces neyagawaensis TaxID=42238 RepID=A0ABV3BCX0_9ACTN
MGRVAGKVVVVTGGARGQGAAEVEALAREGATVLATDVLDAEGHALAGRLAADGLQVSYLPLDVRDRQAWDALAAYLEEHHGRVDALVNNAGVAARDRIPDVDPQAWQRTFDINVTGPLHGIQALVPLMRAGASIVNVCSAPS